MNIFDQLSSLAFHPEFSENNVEPFYIYSRDNGCFIWGELEGSTLGFLCNGVNGAPTMLTGRGYSVKITSRFYEHLRAGTETPDSSFTGEVVGDLSAFLRDKWFIHTVKESCYVEDAPGVIDAIMIPTAVKNRIKHEVTFRGNVLPPDLEINVLLQYEIRELYLAQYEYLKRYPEPLRRKVAHYYRNLEEQVGVYTRLYRRQSFEVVQTLPSV